MGFLLQLERPADSPFVETVWRSRTGSAGAFTSVAASRWEMALVTVDGKTVVEAPGPETGPSEADYPADAEYFGITFGLGAFMPHLPVRTLLERRDATLLKACTGMCSVLMARFGGVDL